MSSERKPNLFLQKLKTDLQRLKSKMRGDRISIRGAFDKIVWPSRPTRAASEMTADEKQAAAFQPDTRIPLWRQLRWNLILSFVLLAVLPMTVVVALTVTRAGAQVRAQVIRQLESVAESKCDQITRWQGERESMLDLFLGDAGRRYRFSAFAARTLRRVEGTPLPVTEEQNVLNRRLGDAVAVQPLLEELFVYNTHGEIVTASDPTQIGKLVTSQPYFAASLQGNLVQPPYYEADRDAFTMLITRPLTDDVSLETVGFLAGRLELSPLSQVMTERTGLGETGETYLVSQQNNYLLTPSRSEDEGYVRTRAYHSEGINRALNGENNCGTYADYREPPETVIGVYRWIPELQAGLLAEVKEAEVLAPSRATRNFSIALTALVALAAGAVGFYNATRISRPITALSKVATCIRDGDLDRQVTIRQRNEVGLLATAFNDMTSRLQEMLHNEQKHRKRLQATVQKYLEYVESVGQGDLTAQLDLDGDGWVEEDEALLGLGHSLNWTTVSWQIMIGQIRDAAKDLNSATAEILAATSQQAAGANEQSAAIAQTTTTVDEVKLIAEQAVSRAQEVADASQRTVQVSHGGRRAVQEIIASMERIKERVESIAENILALSEQTQQIGDIIASVNDLAAQSNMLALNAAIEAARAGEHGKGFAVVAAEVRALAEQSRQATAQVKAILQDIQRATNSTVMATEEGTKGVDEGVLLAAQAQDAIAQLAGVIEESAQAATQVVSGGRQQASGVEQIALAMNSINQATTQSLASTHQAEKTAQDLNALARSLSEIVEQYQV